MANRIQWYLEKRVIYNVLEGNITVKSVANASKIMQTMAEKAGQPIDIIIDATRSSVTPNQLGELTQVTRGLLKGDLVNHMIIVTNDPVQRFLGNIILHVFRKSSKIVENLDAAIVALKALNPGLADLPNTIPNTDIITVDEDA